MATRLYAAASGSPGITPAVDASFEVSGLLKRYAATTATGSTDTGNTTPTTSGSGVANDDTAVFQLVYGPVVAGAITGTLKGQMAGREANGSTDARMQIVARVIAPDGTTVRGTLLVSDTAALSSELNIDTTVRVNRKVPRGGAAALSSVTAISGDYVVLDIGFRNHGTNTSAVRMGFGSTTSDLPEDETDSLAGGAANRAWFEFSQTIALQTTTPVSLGSDSIAVTDTFAFTASADLSSGSLWIGRFNDVEPAYSIDDEILSHDNLEEGGASRPNIILVDGEAASWTEYDRDDLNSREVPVASYLDLPELASTGDVRQRAQQEAENVSRASSPGGTAVWTPLFNRLDHVQWMSFDGTTYETRIEGLAVEFDQSLTPFQRATIDTGVMTICPPDAQPTYVARDLFDRLDDTKLGIADIGGTWVTY